MTTDDIRLTFSKNLKYFLDKEGKKQQDLVDYLGVGKSTVSQWVNGNKMPAMKRIDQICDFFDIDRSDLFESRNHNLIRKENIQEEKITHSDHYLTTKTRRIAKSAYDNPYIQILFEEIQNLSSDDIQLVIDLVKRLGE